MKGLIIFLIYIFGFSYPWFGLSVLLSSRPILDKCNELTDKIRNNEYLTIQEGKEDMNYRARLLKKYLKYLYLFLIVWILGCICSIWCISYSAELINTWQGVNWEIANRSGGGRGSALFLIYAYWRQILFLLYILHLIFMNIVMPIAVLKVVKKRGVNITELLSMIKNVYSK